MQRYIDVFKEKYSTALLADAAYRANVAVHIAPSNLNPVVQSDKLAGPMRTVVANNDLVSILAVVHRAAPGEVIVITNHTKEVGLLGDLIATEAQRKKLGGFIVDGLVRDIPVLVELGIPVFCQGCVPVGPLKLPKSVKGIGEMDVEVTIGEATVHPGWWAFGDADGLIFLEAASLEIVYEQAELTMAREQVLLDAMQNGQALGDLLDLETFLAERARNPAADFNQHLARTARAI